MNLLVSLFLSVLIADTGEVMSAKSMKRFETVEQCENFILSMSKDYPYYRNEQGALVLTNPKNGNIVTALCRED